MMKKIKLLFVGLIAFLSLGFVGNTYAAETVDEEPITEEVVEEETETVVEEEPAFEMPDVTYDNMVEAWSAIIGYVGGASGLIALGMYGIRAWREKKILSATKNMIEEIKTDKDTDRVKIDQLYGVVSEYNTREERMEKAFITLMTMSNVDPKTRKEIISSIENPDVALKDIMTNKLEQIKQEIKQNEETDAEIAATTKSLLSKLTEQDKE